MLSTRSKGKGKGKGKATTMMEPDEREPLLPSSSSEPTPDDYSALSPPPPRTPRAAGLPRQSTPYLFISGVVIFSVLFSSILFLLLLGYSFKPSEAELAVLPNRAFAYSGPDSVHLLDITDQGVWVNVTVRLGIDADLALGVKDWAGREDKEEAVARGERGGGVAWWEKLRRWTARQALAQLPTQAIDVMFPDPINVFPPHFASPPLFSLLINQSLPVPLILDVVDTEKDSDRDWLRPVSFVALAKPIVSGAQLWEYVQRAWIEGEIKAMISVSTVEVALPEGPWWTKYGQLEKQDITMDVRLDKSAVPQLSGFPSPGHQFNLSELVHLDSYSLHTRSSQALSINATASLPNPFARYKVDEEIPFVLPFEIALEDGSPMALVTTTPFRLDDSRTLHLSLAGDIIANLSEQITPQNETSTLSLFLQRFLHGQDNPIIVTGSNTLPPSDSRAPPPWLLSLLPSVSVHLSFPGPQPPPKIIKSVEIEHMRIKERSGQIYASGTVLAKVELPEMMQRIELVVQGVRPDVLIYDGEAGDEPADPDDPPPRAFGRIAPEYFLNSTTSPSDDPAYPHRIIVEAPMEDVPLKILEGRDGVFRSFASKVVFKGGAEAGIKGTASVRVELEGVKGKAGLSDLPVTGETWVGRQRFNWLRLGIGTGISVED